jgi:hypothetical protein
MSASLSKNQSIFPLLYTLFRSSSRLFKACIFRNCTTASSILDQLARCVLSFLFPTWSFWLPALELLLRIQLQVLGALHLEDRGCGGWLGG